MNGKTQPEGELFSPCYYKECRGSEMPPKPKSKTPILCTERQGAVIRPPFIFSQPLTPQPLISHSLRSPRSLGLSLSSSPSLSPNPLAPLGVGRSSAHSNPVVGVSVTKHKESLVLPSHCVVCRLMWITPSNYNNNRRSVACFPLFSPNLSPIALIFPTLVPLPSGFPTP